LPNDEQFNIAGLPTSPLRAARCNGSVEFFRTYPGMDMSRPLLLRCQEMWQSLGFLAEAGNAKFRDWRPGGPTRWW
jgi:hypothetical protein